MFTNISCNLLTSSDPNSAVKGHSHGIFEVSNFFLHDAKTDGRHFEPMPYPLLYTILAQNALENLIKIFEEKLSFNKTFFYFQPGLH